MGTIISHIGAIENILWRNLKKGQVTDCKRVILFDDGSAIIELKTGEFTVVGRHHSPNGNWAVLNYGLDKFTNGVLHGLVKLGILDKKQVKEHIETADVRKSAQERKRKVAWLKELCEELKVPVPELPE